jgi:hypothetical protein
MRNSFVGSFFLLVCTAQGALAQEAPPSSPTVVTPPPSSAPPLTPGEPLEPAPLPSEAPPFAPPPFAPPPPARSDEGALRPGLPAEPLLPARGPVQGAAEQPEPSTMSTAPVQPAQKPTPYESVPSWSKIALKLEGPHGTSIRFGTVTQLQYEALGAFGDRDVAQNFFVRRTMLLLGGTVLHDLEYFIDTDFADLFKAAGDMSQKNGPGISLKDVFITYNGFGDVFKVDGGLMLPPLSHSSLQGAPFLLGLDFFANTYRHSAAYGAAANSFGRDLGVQLRGLVFGGHLEYRAGVFQGKRDAPTPGQRGARNPFRAAGRVQLNLLDAETAFFYRGTYLGDKRLLSFGATFDVQPSDGKVYRSWGLDAIVDIAGVSGQVNFVSRDGDGVVALQKQSAIMAEAGYLLSFLRLSPILRFERRWGPGTALDETDIGGGLSFWAFNHTSNLKAFYIRGKPGGSVPDYDQFNAQWQLAFF